MRKNKQKQEKQTSSSDNNFFSIVFNARRFVTDVITIITHTYLCLWLWKWNQEYISNIRNNMTMVYGLLCLTYSPRLSPRSIFYATFIIGLYGYVIQWMWWSANRDWLWIACRCLSVVFGMKSLYKLYRLLVEFVL